MAVAIISFILAAFFMPVIHTAQAASLSELQAKLNKAEADLQKYQELQKNEQVKATAYQNEINTTQQEINEVRSTINDLDKQIKDKESEIDATTKEFIQKSEELNALNSNLNSSLATLYELTNFSQLEMTANAGSISHYADRSEFMQALQSRILEDIESTNKIKQDLDNKNKLLAQKKNELSSLKGDQEEKSSELAAEKQQQTSLLTKTKANEAQFRAQTKRLEEQKNGLSKEIFELRRSLSRGNSGERVELGVSAYPWDVGPNVWRQDPWDFFMSECTSYAAWKWYQYYGTPFREYKIEAGDAYNWPTIARNRGYRTSNTPRANAVISWPRGSGMPYGHVAWVESVNNDGTINISEYNWVSPGHEFSRRYNVNFRQWGNATFIYK